MKTKNEVWMQFASTALSTVIMQTAPGTLFADVAAEAADLADAMTAEWEKRQEQSG